MIYLAYLAYWLWTFDCPTSKELRWRLVVISAGFPLVYFNPQQSIPRLLCEWAIWFDVALLTLAILNADTRFAKEVN